jgi:serine/threonine protein kinase
MPAQTPNARSIFERALEIASNAERQAYLDGACDAQPELRDRVDALLRAHAAAGSFLEQPALTVDQTRPFEPIAERPGTQIGPYKLLEQIGEGGFGVVFMAEQERPVRRRVALKVIKPGMDTRQVIARFEAERQALALMDHPNIAHVLEAGATESGRPYFVMELVRGIPVTEFCDQNRLTIDERLKLFTTVCHAVQHAHQKAIIHRDIKPSNVLVTLHDGEPVAKVIDFGVAKATAQRLTEKTLFTAFAEMIGTPLYMSPEQAEMSGLDVDTRSDIYSLGVLLYELLTGTTPFDRSRLQHAAYDELRRIICEEEPPKPSTRISTLGPTATMVSAQRKSDPDKLRRLVRGELDWIVMKCLDKDRNRRYDSAGSLARDVERYLRQEPVQACPPTAMYRFRKFIRRNKVALLTGAGIATGLGLALLVVGAALRINTLMRRNYELQGYRPVYVTTEPAGARVAIVSVNERTGELNPDPAGIIRPRGTTPLTVELKPGHYFVEAVLPGDEHMPDFAEVYRVVPEPRPEIDRMISKRDPTRPFPLDHIGVARGTESIVKKMIRVPIDAAARRKNPLLPEVLYVDPKETSPHDHWPVSKDSDAQITADGSNPIIRFDGAMSCAARKGKRLPTAAEYDVIAKYVQQQQIAATSSAKPAGIEDLFAGVAEWTTSKYVYRGATQNSEDVFRDHFVVRGYGNADDFPGLIQTADGQLIAPRYTSPPLIGFRGVRSGAPRFVNE